MELLREVQYLSGLEEKIADYLIRNGVTVQKWIPVTERLPDNKEHDWVLAQVVEDNGYMHIPKVMEYRQSKKDWFEETYGWLSEHNGAFTVTHWMPLPEPPKGGCEMKGNCGECDRRWHCDIGPYKCDEWPDPVPMSNADRIRSMSDEELAVLLSKPCECSVDPNEDGYRECGNKFCIEYLLNWLQQPAEGE